VDFARYYFSIGHDTDIDEFVFRKSMFYRISSHLLHLTASCLYFNDQVVAALDWERAVAAVDVSLSSSDIEYLEEPYEPVPVSGHE